MPEFHPHGRFVVRLERRPFLKQTLEGRLQRQMVLYLQGLDIPDPLKTLEEITRHHLPSGELPMCGLLAHDELEGLVADCTACLVSLRPERTSQVGDRQEGCITLPVPELKPFYRWILSELRRHGCPTPQHAGGRALRDGRALSLRLGLWIYRPFAHGSHGDRRQAAEEQGRRRARRRGRTGRSHGRSGGGGGRRARAGAQGSGP